MIARLRSAAVRWRTAAAIVCNVLLAEVGARIGLPGVDAQRVREFLHAMPRGLLSVFDSLVGGGLSRAALFGLGAVPYLQAKLYLWLARLASPTIRRATETASSRRAVVRLGTVGLALLQSWGFAQFLQRIPGAVADPGVGFMTRTVLLITGGAVLTGWLGETVAELVTAESSVDDPHDQHVPMPVPVASAPIGDRSRGPVAAAGVPLLEPAWADVSHPSVTAERDRDRVR